MKRSNLQGLLYQHLGCWKIVNVGYNEVLNQVVLLLQEYGFVQNDLSKDEYALNNFKKLVVLDEFAFNYYEDGVLTSAIEQFLHGNKELDLQQLEIMLSNKTNIETTEIQNGWLTILKDLGLFDFERYKQNFINELHLYLTKLGNGCNN